MSEMMVHAEEIFMQFGLTGADNIHEGQGPIYRTGFDVILNAISNFPDSDTVQSDCSVALALWHLRDLENPSSAQSGAWDGDSYKCVDDDADPNSGKKWTRKDTSSSKLCEGDVVELTDAGVEYWLSGDAKGRVGQLGFQEDQAEVEIPGWMYECPLGSGDTGTLILISEPNMSDDQTLMPYNVLLRPQNSDFSTDFEAKIWRFDRGQIRRAESGDTDGAELQAKKINILVDAMDKNPLHQPLQRAGVNRLQNLVSRTATAKMVHNAGGVNALANAMHIWNTDEVILERGCQAFVSLLTLPVDEIAETEGILCTGSVDSESCGAADCPAYSRLGAIVHDKISGDFIKSVIIEMVAAEAEDAIIQDHWSDPDQSGSMLDAVPGTGWCQAAASVYREASLANEDVVPERLIDDSDEEVVVIDTGTHNGIIMTHNLARMPVTRPNDWAVLQEVWAPGSFLELLRSAASPFSMDVMEAEKQISNNQAKAIRRGVCRTLGASYEQEKNAWFEDPLIEDLHTMQRDAQIVVAAIEDHPDSKRVATQCVAALTKMCENSHQMGQLVLQADGLNVMLQTLEIFQFDAPSVRKSGFAMFRSLIHAGYGAVDLVEADDILGVLSANAWMFGEDSEARELVEFVVGEEESGPPASVVCAAHALLRITVASKPDEVVEHLRTCAPALVESLLEFNQQHDTPEQVRFHKTYAHEMRSACVRLNCSIELNCCRTAMKKISVNQTTHRMGHLIW